MKLRRFNEAKEIKESEFKLEIIEIFKQLVDDDDKFSYKFYV